MNATSIRRYAASAAVLALGLSITACGAANEEPADGASDSKLSGTLNGAGSSAQEAAMAAWQAGFQTANPDVTVNYDPVGSGGGREQFIAGGIPFAGSDSYLTDEEGELSKAKERCNGEDPIEVPDYVSPIAVTYNVDGVDDLQLDGSTIAQIFAGKITEWDDPAIADQNPDADLPSEPITPVHRSDDSGTTENFTAYLNTVDPQSWSDEPDGVWPIKGGEAASGTSGVVAAVKNGSNTIGYADASQAGELDHALVKVGSEYAEPTAEAAAKVLEISPRVEGRADSDMAIDLDRATEDSGAYPIVLTSYLIACPTYKTADEADLVKAFLTYVVGEDGQNAAAENAGSAPLASSLQDEALGIIDGIKAQG